MKLSTQQTNALLDLVTASQADDMDCDGCFEHVAEFIELELRGTAFSDALQKVERHLSQCACCRSEYGMLREAVLAISGR